MSTWPQNKVEASEATLRNIMLQVPVAMSVVVGPQFIIEVVNKKQLELWQKEEAEVIHKPVFVVFPELKSHEFDKLLTEVYHTGIPYEGREMAAQLLRNGILETAYFDFTYEPMRNKFGEVEGIIVVSTEVTANVLARKQVEASEAFNRTILESSPDCLTVLDREGRIQFMNSRGLCLLEIDDFSTVRNKYWWAIWGSENETLVKAAVNKALTGDPAHFTAFCTTFIGTPKWWDVVVTPIGKSGEPVQQIIAVSRDISREKKIENALRKSKELLQGGLKVANVALAEIDYRTGLVSLSEESARMFGLPPDQLTVTREQLHATFYPEEKVQLMELIEQSITPGSNGLIETEHRILLPSGAVRWLKINKEIFFDKPGTKPLYGILASQDITEKKITEENTQQSEKRFRSLAENSPDVISLHDKNFRYLYASPNIERITGVKAADTIGKTYREIGIPEELCVFFDEQLSLAFRKRSLHTVEFRGQNGMFLYSRLVPEYNEDGEPLSVLIINTDITIRKNQEEKLRQSDELFRTFANSIQNLAWIANGDGWIYWYNQRWYDYTGTTIEEMQGWGWEKVHHPDHMERVVNFAKEAWTKDKAYELTFPLRRHDGEFRWFLTRAYPITDAEGKIERWIGTNTDITEQKNFAEELERKVKERTEELQQQQLALELTNAELASFSYVASHDLQEPLRKIQTFSRLILGSEEFPAKTQHYFNRIIAAGERMQNLIVSLLEFSSLNAAGLVFTPCNLNTIVNESISDLHQRIIEKQAIIEHENLPTINGVRVQLLQLFTNLIENAIKYSRPEKILHVTITASIIEGKEIKNSSANTKRDYHALNIADNGIGFENEYATKIFELFQRLHPKNEYSGTGIGLTIVKKIVTNHNGIIIAKGKPNSGSTFTIYFPIA